MPDGFEEHRDHLMAVAYRMLGSHSDAEDAVQEAWLRWHTAREGVRNPRAWLTAVTARICLDQLRSARARRETYVGQWLPEPVVEPVRAPAGGGLGADPAERAERTDQVSYALLVVLEQLTPEQRVAFVLHDLFAVPFDEIAPLLATTPAAARQLASRARRVVAAGDHPRRTAGPTEHRRVLAAFLDAASSGDIDGLLAVLAPDAVMIGDGGGLAPASPRPVEGATAVARFVAGLFRRYVWAAERAHLEPVLLNGDLGVMAAVELPGGGQLTATLALTVADGRVTGIFSQVNPAKLTRLPAPDPSNALRPWIWS